MAFARHICATAAHQKIKIRADGVYGSGTAKTVSRFQKSVGLKPTGVVNRTTWMALLSASAQR